MRVESQQSQQNYNSLKKSSHACYLNIIIPPFPMSKHDSRDFRSEAIVSPAESMFISVFRTETKDLV